MSYDKIPVNKNASESARRLLEYLADVAGKKILTGQHTQTTAMEEYNLIHELTGRYPKVVGFELLSYSPNINYEDADEACLTEVYENRDTLKKAMEIIETTDSIQLSLQTERTLSTSSAVTEIIGDLVCSSAVAFCIAHTCRIRHIFLSGGRGYGEDRRRTA